MQRCLRTAARAVAGVLLLLTAGACRSFESRLPPESAIPELHELAMAYDRQPRDTVFANGVDREFGDIEIAVHEVGTGDHERLLVMVHGVFADHRTWRYMAGALADDYDVWALDLPGCGVSDAPNAFLLEPEAYSPDWLARLCLDALRERLATRRVPTKITLVGHSLGGGVLLRMLGDETLRAGYADVLEHVDGAVLLAPLDFGVGAADPQFRSIVDLSTIEKLLGTAIGLARRKVAEATYYGGFYPERVPIEEFEHTWEVFTKEPRWRAAQAMLARALPHDENGHRDWKRSAKLVEDYRNVEVPCLILWGECDETLVAQSGDSLVHELPKSWVRTLRECKHCLPTEEPRLCIDEIQCFLSEDHSAWPEHAHRDRPSNVATLEQQSLKGTQEGNVSSGRRAPVVDAPSTVTVLRGRDLQRSGARYLSDALRLVPGVEVQRLSSTESDVAFRGYADSATAAQGTLGLVDGRQVLNPFLGNVLWDQLAVRMEDIEQVEVIRGPASFLHGPGALHGVVSVETRSPLHYPRSSASASAAFGGPDSTLLGASVVHRTEETGLRIATLWDDIGRFDEGIPGGPEAGRDKLLFNLDYEARLDGDPGHVLGFQGGGAEQRFDLLLPSLAGLPPARLDSRAREGYAQLNYRRGQPKRNLFELRAGWTTFDSDSVATAFYLPFTLKIDTYDLEARSTWKGDGHAVTAGAGYRLSTFGTRDFDVTEGRHDVHESWLFAQDDIALTNRLSLTLGARADLHSTTDESISPRAAIVWRIVDEHYLRLSAGRGFRNPSLRELWFDMPLTGLPQPASVRGNVDLEPERLTSYEAGWFGSWGSVLDLAPGAIPGAGDTAHRFEGGVTTFYNQIDDLISFDPTPGPTVMAPQNMPGEEAFGVEFEGRHVLSDWFSTFGNYSWSQRRDRATHTRNLIAPEHKANLGVTFSGDRFEAMLWGNYYDATELFGQRIGSYLLLNGSLSYRFELNSSATGRLFVRAFNLLDDDHREHPEGDAYGLMLSAGVQFEW